MSDTQNMRPDPNALAIYPLAAVEGPFRFYLAQQGTTETHVRLWSEADATYVATTIGGPSRITFGRYATDEEAIRSHLKVNDDSERNALARGIQDGWTSAQSSAGSPRATIWSVARLKSELFYPNGWNGGEAAAQCRAAYVGGWAIGVERAINGERADGTNQPKRH